MKEVPRKKAAAKKERLSLKAEWEWLYQKWNVKTGITKSGVTIREKAEKEIKSATRKPLDKEKP